MRSIVVSFFANDLVAARLTSEMEDCAVRMTITDELLEDGLDVHYEILGPSKSAREAIIENASRLFDATFKVTQDRELTWTATACFRDLSALEDHPVYSTLLGMRDRAYRTMIVIEAGMVILRVDFEDESEVTSAQEAFRQALASADIHGMVRAHNLGRSLEDWEPLSMEMPERP